MRLRSADKDHATVVTVAKTVNVSGTITATTSSFTVAPMAAVDLGSMAPPGPGGGEPASTTEWTIAETRNQ